MYNEKQVYKGFRESADSVVMQRSILFQIKKIFDWNWMSRSRWISLRNVDLHLPTPLFRTKVVFFSIKVERINHL